MEREQTLISGLEEVPLTFDCLGDALLGVLHKGASDASTGVLIIVGGRQYRAGAHRQFVKLARYLALHGIPVLRFDVRGMGDSEGKVRHFLSLDEDIKAAVSALQLQEPNLEKIVLWGLCDGASAGIAYAPSDRAVAGVMLVNPWISTESGVARTYLRHYYRERFWDTGFWRKIVKGQVNWRASLRSLAQTAFRLRDRKTEDARSTVILPDIIFDALSAFKGNTRILISDRDMTAREFEDEFNKRVGDGRLPEGRSVQLIRAAADHTFSDPVAHEHLAELTLAWVREFS